MIILTLGLISAACSGNNSTTDGDGESPSAGGEGVEQGAGAVGVTDDSIKIGFTYLDLSAVSEITGVNHGPHDQHMQALVDDLNASGGINGREIELVARGHNPLDAESTQAVCLELTEDHQVFAVIGGLRGDQVLCYTEQHETIAVAAEGLTAERQERAKASYAAAAASQERILEGFIEEAAAEGRFDGLRVAVRAALPSDQTTATDIVIPALGEVGVDVV